VCFYSANLFRYGGTHTGTEVKISEIQKNFPSLEGPNVVQEMAASIGAVLRKYPGVQVSYDGTVVDPILLKSLLAITGLGEIQLQKWRLVTDGTLTVIEWRTPADKSILLCDANGFALAEIPAGVQAPGFNFTAYLRSDYIRELDQAGALIFEELDPISEKFLDAARNRLKDHFRQRNAALARNVVREWKDQDIYPYKDETRDVLEEAERQMFDVLALNV